MRIHRSFDGGPLIAARSLFPGLTDAEIITKALANLAGVAEPPSAKERHKAGVERGGKARGEQIAEAARHRARVKQ